MSTDKRNKLSPRKTPTSRRRSIEEAFIPADAKPAPEPTQMYNIKMPVELHRRTRMQAFKEDRTMKDIIIELLREYLEEHEE